MILDLFIRVISSDDEYTESMREEIESDYDIDTDTYQPIQPVGDNHSVMLVSPKLSRVHIHDLQCMHHGTTAVHWDDGNTHSAICYIRLENDNGTLSWCKPQWSALRGVSTSAPDYVFKKDFATPGISSRYGHGIQVNNTCRSLQRGISSRYVQSIQVNNTWRSLHWASGADFR